MKVISVITDKRSHFLYPKPDTIKGSGQPDTGYDQRIMETENDQRISETGNDQVIRKTISGSVYGCTRVRSLGNNIASRIFSRLHIFMTSRSSPMDQPACGGAPILNAFK